MNKTRSKPANTSARSASSAITQDVSPNATKVRSRPRRGPNGNDTRSLAPEEMPVLTHELSSPVPAAESQAIVMAKVDVGLGNTVFIRGQGAGLSWEEGVPLNCVDGSTWFWSAPTGVDKIQFKLLLNDRVWCHGEDLTAEGGSTTRLTPRFE